MPNGQTALPRLKVLQITQHEMPFTDKCEAKKGWKTEIKKRTGKCHESKESV